MKKIGKIFIFENKGDAEHFTKYHIEPNVKYFPPEVKTPESWLSRYKIESLLTRQEET